MNFWRRLSLRQRVLSLFFLHAGLLVIFVFFRYLDADEGLYLSAAREVFWGHRPYLDFMYVQTPYYPYFLAPLSHFGWSGLFFCRLISALAPLFTGALIFSLARRLWNEKTAFVLWGLWILNGLVLVWGSVAKPAGWGDFFLFLGFWALASETGQRKIRFFFSGAAAGMGANFRGFLLFPSAFWAALLLLQKGHRAKNFLFWSLGFLAALSFSLYFIFQSPAAFFFNNYTYHQLWGNEVVAAGGQFGWVKRLTAIVRFLFFPQNFILYGLALLGLLHRPLDAWRRKVLHLAFGTVAVLHLVFILSTPSMGQYYAEALPYLALLAGFGWNYLEERSSSWLVFLRKWGLGLAHVISLALVAYIFLFGQRSRDREFIRPVVDYLARKCNPADTVLSEWPGWAVLSGMQLPRGMETVGLDVTHLLSSKEKQAYRILDSVGVDSLLTGKKVKWVVMGGVVAEHWPRPPSLNYTPAFRSGPVTVYRRNE